jgi:hypothetical protein
MNTTLPAMPNKALADDCRARLCNGWRATSVAAATACVRRRFALTGEPLWRIAAADHKVWQKRLSALMLPARDLTPQARGGTPGREA